MPRFHLIVSLECNGGTGEKEYQSDLYLRPT